MTTLQVKGIDNGLYEALKQNAEQATHEFLKLSGAWAGSESATKILNQIRQGRKYSRIGPKRILNYFF